MGLMSGFSSVADCRTPNTDPRIYFLGCTSVPNAYSFSGPKRFFSM
jgi:hypothetical protein